MFSDPTVITMTVFKLYEVLLNNVLDNPVLIWPKAQFESVFI